MSASHGSPKLPRRGRNVAADARCDPTSVSAVDRRRYNGGDHWENLLAPSNSPQRCHKSDSGRKPRRSGVPGTDLAFNVRDMPSSIEYARHNGDLVLQALKTREQLEEELIDSLARQQQQARSEEQVIHLPPVLVALPGRPKLSTSKRAGRRFRGKSPTGLEGGHLADDEQSQSKSAHPDADSTPRDKSAPVTSKKQRRGEKQAGNAEVGDVVESGRAFKMKTEAKRFDAELCSFRDIVNAENTPTTLSDVLDRLKPQAGGANFAWERKAAWGRGYGGGLTVKSDLILWYHNSDNPDTKTGVSTTVSFLHKPGCVYMFQPVLPTTSLMLIARPAYRPMFEHDGRSFHAFKLAWRHYLDFGVNDYRIIVGEQLDQWTQRFKYVIDKPTNAVYWLMIMVGSHYRETLVKRGVLEKFEEGFERVPVICIDSFVALSALLFSPERQVIYAGIDPTPSYLQWLQHVSDQHSYRKDPKIRKQPATVFERNELLDLSAIIVFYGRIQQKAKESARMSWIGNPDLIKKHIAKYCEDNLCGTQLEEAIRLYTYTCTLGQYKAGAQAGGQSWLCWNGLGVCEVGVPMPSTRASFLSPFVVSKPVALLCPIHGPDAGLAADSATKKDNKKPSKKPSSRAARSRGMSLAHSEDSHPRRTIGPNSRASPSGRSSKTPSEVDHTSSEQSSEECDLNTSDGQDSSLNDINSSRQGGDKDKACSCVRHIRPELQKKAKRKHPGQPEIGFSPEMEQALRSLGEFDVMHCFAAVLAGGLNFAKLVLRVHFSIDPKAYQHLAPPMNTNWQDGMLPWYNEFHRTSIHGRSRYNALLGSVLRGLLGDGYTSGLHDEVLDVMRVSMDSGSKEGMPEASGFGGRKLEADAPVRTLSNAGEALGQNVERRVSSLRPSVALSHHSSVADTPHLSAATMEGSKNRVSSVTLAEDSGRVTSAASQGGRQASSAIGVVSDMLLWTELYETESVFNHRAHLETFSQWCCSAQLIPFLKRCYRRCGIAGLLPGQRCGGGAQVQSDPSYPLVLPTIPSFCYGQGYPLHRVLEYFYGGVSTIVASVVDPVIVDAARAALPLISGQERLNNLFWFQVVPDQYAIWKREASGKGKESILSMQMLQQLQNAFGRTTSEASEPSVVTSRSVPHIKNSVRGRATLTPRVGRPTLFNAPTRLSAAPGASRRVTSDVTNDDRPGSALSRLQDGERSPRSKPPLTSRSRHSVVKAKQKATRKVVRLGALVPDDPFFWFCSQNFALCTYPADIIPKHSLSDGSSLVFHYSDVVSRTGSPEASSASHPDQARRDSVGSARSGSPTVEDETSKSQPPAESNMSSIAAPVPPAICLCQPTEMTEHPRVRWEIDLEFVDDRGLILGDAGWFPGALGQRFIFEVKSENIDRFIRLSEVPQGQLLYIEHLKLSQADLKKKTRDQGLFKDDLWDSDSEANSANVPSSSSGSEVSRSSSHGGKTRSRKIRLTAKQQRDNKKKTERAAGQLAGKSESLMLPPLLRCMS